MTEKSQHVFQNHPIPILPGLRQLCFPVDPSQSSLTHQEALFKCSLNSALHSHHLHNQTQVLKHTHAFRKEMAEFDLKNWLHTTTVVRELSLPGLHV